MRASSELDQIIYVVGFRVEPRLPKVAEYCASTNYPYISPCCTKPVSNWNKHIYKKDSRTPSSLYVQERDGR